MNRTVATILLTMIAGGCGGPSDSQHRAAAGAGYTPPSAAARADAARRAAQAQPDIRNPHAAGSVPSIDPMETLTQTPLLRPQQQQPQQPQQQAQNERPPDPPWPGRDISPEVDAHYQRELMLQEGNTLPEEAAPAPVPQRQESSWWDSLFGSDEPVTAAGGATPVRSCYSGRLTNEGVTCQAMRTDDGRLLTLGGPLRGFGPGDRVCVCGPVAETAFCEQGTTIYIAEISARCGVR
jgi:hypothetical protein